MKKSFCVSVNDVASLDNIVCKIRGGQFCSVWYDSDVPTMDGKLIGGKRNPLHGRLSAFTCKDNLQASIDYEKTMQKRVDPDFKAEHLPWGTWFAYKRIIAHKGNHYLRLTETTKTNRKVVYYLDGQVVTDADLNEYIESQLRPETDKPVKPFNIMYGNIRRLKAEKRCYEISL